MEKKREVQFSGQEVERARRSREWRARSVLSTAAMKETPKGPKKSVKVTGPGLDSTSPSWVGSGM